MTVPVVGIYEPMVPEGFEWVVLDRDEDHNILLDLEANRAGPSWQPLAARLLTHDDRTGRRLKPARMPWLGRHVLVLRDEAIELAGSLLEPYGEVLPLVGPDARLALVHVTSMVDVLDEQQSEILRFPSTGRIMKIARHAFKSGIVRPPQAFKIPQLTRGAVFLTEDLVRSIEMFGFEGTTFRLVGEAMTA